MPPPQRRLECRNAHVKLEFEIDICGKCPL